MRIRRSSSLLWMAWLLGALARPAAAQSMLPVFDPANGHWYQAVPVPGGIDWPSARTAAEALSYAGWPGHLATITSDDEQQFVSRHLPVQQQPYWWMGAYQDKTAPDYVEPGGGWRWITGEPWGTYANWSANQPDNARNAADPDGENVLEFDTRSSNTSNVWNDVPTHLKIDGYLVEYEPALPPGSAVGLLLFPPALLGGQNATGQVQIARPAGAGGVVVPLVSSNPAVATVPATIRVPAGASTATFLVATSPVTAPTSVLLHAGGAAGAVAATLQVQPRLPSSSNLLINGSFEEPRLSSSMPAQQFDGQLLPGWTVRGDVLGVVTLVGASVRQPAPGEGDQSLDLVGLRSGTSIEQTIATEPGHEYVFSGWLAHDTVMPDRFRVQADVTLNGQFFVKLYRRDPQAARNSMRWEPFAYRFRATATRTALRIQDTSEIWARGPALDNLAVTPVELYPSPPPPLPPPAPNLLVNGSFELPDLSGFRFGWGRIFGTDPGAGSYRGSSVPGWQITLGTATIGHYHWSSAEGLQSIELAGSSGGGRIEQRFPTEPGRDYVLSGYLSQHPILNGGAADVFIDNTFLAQVSHLGYQLDPTEWTFFVLPFRATTFTTTLAISDATGSGRSTGALLDGLAVTPADAIPAPAPGSLPIPPTHLTARPAGDQIELTWDDNSSDETSFTILRSSPPFFERTRLVTLGPNVDHYVDRDVQPGTTYVYSLLVQSEVGSSPGVGFARATLGSGPPGPEGALLVGDGEGVSRFDPRTGARLEVLAPYSYGGLGGVADLTLGPDGWLYVASGGNKVLRFDPQTGAYGGTLVLADSGGLYAPRGLAFGPDGNLYVTSYETHQVLRYDGRTGAFLGVFVPRGRGGLEWPTGIRFGPDGNLYVVSQGSRNIPRFDGRTGAFLGTLQGLGASTLEGPGGMTFGPDGNLYVTNYGTDSVLRFNPATGALLGTFVAPHGGGLHEGSGLTFGPDGDLYVISRATHNVLRYDGRTGAFLGVFFAGDPAALLFLPS